MSTPEPARPMAVKAEPRMPRKRRPLARASTPESPQPPPSLLARAVRYAWSTLRWSKGGGKTRSQAEIDRIFAICQRCPLSTQKKDGLVCSECGCTCSSAKNGLTNKIARATEHCPLKPRW